ncbi:hypothetical protein [Roseivirga sp. UBA838]|uniref:hypothetical protein n=1 Tax=Roseivirga sp. UBA838 TaxID=1947393 RepID=UPI002580AB5C|nr:hypothetical protein [Roseivirga sp. UBA838]|tara:strand:+ start:21422 stop:21916 length:495 start_codon:yes stop_codon:yes gene_type:complete
MEEIPQLERLAAERLLERGVSMQMRAPFFLRWFGKKTVALTVTSPMQGTMLEVSRLYLSTGITSQQLKGVSHEQALALMHSSGKVITRAVATAWLNSKWKIKMFARPLAHYMLWHCRPVEILTIMNMILLFGGTQSFMNTTRSARLIQIMTTKPKLGQTPEESQ